MYFLIGVVLLMIFVLFLIIKIKRAWRDIGLSGWNLKEVIEEARLEDQEVPKSLSSMDSIYLTSIQKDFPDISIDELKRESEKIILDCYRAVERRDVSPFSGKIKSFVEQMISDYHGKKVIFQNFKIHRTVVSNYKREKGTATISFSSSYEYVFVTEDRSVKVQDRARTEFIYVVDEKEISDTVLAIGVHCPNCGSPLTSLGEKHCSYCGTAVQELFHRVFICNDIVRY